MYYLFLSILFIPNLALAHVKWFVDTDEVIANSHGVTPFYSWGSKEVLIWGAIILITVFIFSLIDTYTKSPKKLLSFGLNHEKSINRVSQVVLGIFLVTVSFIWKIILVPDMHVDSTITHALEILQALIGVMYIFNIKPRLASGLLLILCAGLFWKEGFLALLENAILVSLALYFFIVNSKDTSIFAKYKKHAVEIVRIGTGVSLITLAFTEKMMYPELSLDFLSVHHWNFMQSLFPWFTDKLFVLSTGFAEMIFGILFILGYITRITTVLIAIFFAFSVITMLTQFGKWEVEDLQVYSAAILFIFFGHGKTKFFHFMWPNSKLHKRILKIN
jgi:uncharacterized membrane protein YphA (DoxX/SURF4 family)